MMEAAKLRPVLNAGERHWKQYAPLKLPPGNPFPGSYIVFGTRRAGRHPPQAKDMFVWLPRDPGSTLGPVDVELGSLADIAELVVV